MKTVTLLVLVLLQSVFLIGLGGCTLFKSSDTSPTNIDRTLWRSGQQNVKIERQDTKSNGPNDHPIVLDPDQVKGALAALEVRLKPNARPIPVFTSQELETLGKQLSDGIAQAGPDQDVTFAVVGQRKALYGFAKERVMTTGRVFYREGKLNVIFGNMVENIGQYDGTSAKPLTTQNPVFQGSRTKPVSRSWALEAGTDMRFYAGADMVRSDWVVLDLASMAAHQALGMKPAKEEPAVVQGPTPVPVEQAPVAVQPAQPVQTVQPPKTSKTIEERLRILDELKRKKLITEQEYKAKRANILSDL
ncbi:MAG: hypothetical protein H6Q57_887 [Geobacteraceae bacterium]|nr:hypothetical protein [Geobacteraceae bacterium]